MLAVSGEGGFEVKVKLIVAGLVFLLISALLVWLVLASQVGSCSNCNPWGTPYPTLEWDLMGE